MADAGMRDTFIPYNIIGEAKLERLMYLARRVTLSVTADSVFTVHGYAAAAQREGADWNNPTELPVLAEFDTGMGRCGVQSPREAGELAYLITWVPGLHFSGLMTHPNNAHSDRFVRQARVLLKMDGIAVE